MISVEEYAKLEKTWREQQKEIKDLKKKNEKLKTAIVDLMVQCAIGRA